VTPPKARLVVRAQADRDLDELAEFIGRDSPSAAYGLLDAAVETFEHLVETPEMGSPRDFARKGMEGIRVWPVRGYPNHLIFYRVSADAVEVIRVAHGARDLDRLFED